MRENRYRTLKCMNYGLEADRDTIAILNIERKTTLKMGVVSDPARRPRR